MKRLSLRESMVKGLEQCCNLKTDLPLTSPENLFEISAICGLKIVESME